MGGIKKMDENRRIALEKGEATFVSLTPCKKHPGNRIKFTKGSRCVQCQREDNAAWYKKQSSEYKRAQSEKALQRAAIKRGGVRRKATFANPSEAYTTKETTFVELPYVEPTLKERIRNLRFPENFR